MLSPDKMNRAARPIATSLQWGLLVTASLLSGCVSPSRFSFVSLTPKTQAYTIDYAIADAGGNLSADHGPGDSHIRAAAWLDDADQLTFGPRRAASLKIEFPHPVDGPGAALATLAVYDDPDSMSEFAPPPPRRQWWNPLTFLNRRNKQTRLPPSAPAEVVTMTIPRAQFEMLMSDLHREEYADDSTPGPNARPDSAVSLSISHNQREAHHSSVSEPRLDEFMRRVYSNGDVILGDRHVDCAVVGLSPEVAAPDPVVN